MTAELVGVVLGAVFTSTLGGLVLWARRSRNDTAEALVAAASAVAAMSPILEARLAEMDERLNRTSAEYAVALDRLGYAEGLIETFLAWFDQHNEPPPVAPNGPRYPDGFAGPRSSRH